MSTLPAVSTTISTLPEGQGLLIAAVDPLKHVTCIVGCVPAAEGANLGDAAGG